MDLDLNRALDSAKEGTKEIAETAQEKASEFHDNYVSEVLPDCGKYGDAAKFAAELVPGVSEYNAIREGDWKALAISAGIDVGAVAVGAFTAGAGSAAVKGGIEALKTGAKSVAKEGLEEGAKTAVEKTAEVAGEKVSKDAVETGLEKTAEEIAESGTEKVALKVGEAIDKTKIPQYLDELENITSREIPSNQKELLEKALKENDFTKLTSEATSAARKEFKNNRDKLIKEWEKMTDQTWPRYTEDVLNEAGEVIKKAGQTFDVHHIIELSTSGPNEWWNLQPASNVEHKLIHSAENLANKIFS